MLRALKASSNPVLLFRFSQKYHSSVEVAALSTLVAANNCFASFAVGSASAFGLAFVPELLSARDRQLDFDASILEIHACRDERQALLLCLPDQLLELVPMHQQFSGAQSRVVRVTAVFVWADVAVEKPQFAVLHQPVGILEVRLAGSDGLDLGASQRNAGLKFFQQEVVM